MAGDTCGVKNDRSNLDRYRQAVEKLQKEQALDMLRRNIDVILEFGSWRHQNEDISGTSPRSWRESAPDLPGCRY